MIDIHNHLLINLDDGPNSEKEALNLIKQAKKNGVTDIVITPHHCTDEYFNPRNKILAEIKHLNQVIKSENLDINIYPGQEIRINGEIIEDLARGINISLNNSRYVLIELPYNEVPYYTENIFFELQMNGYTPIIAHPERCKEFKEHPFKLYELIKKGAIAQITAGSIVGSHGIKMQKLSLEMLRKNLIHIIGSDAHHSVKRPFMLQEAFEVISEELGNSYVDYFKYNAESILKNKEIKVREPIGCTNKTRKTEKRKKFLGLF